MRTPYSAAAGIAAIIMFSVSPLWSEKQVTDIQSISSRNLKRYTIHDGLPQSTINCMIVDKSGLLWVGTQDGASYYNGRTRQTVVLPDREISDNILSMYCAEDSSIYLGMDNGKIYRLKNDVWTVLGSRDAWITSRIWDISEWNHPSGRKVLIVATNIGLYYYDGSRFIGFNCQRQMKKRLIVRCIQKGIRQDVWLATNQGLFRLQDTLLINVPCPPSISTPNLYSLLMDGESSLWCGGDDVLYRYVSGTWTQKQIGSKIGFNPLRSLHKGSDGALWIGGHYAVIRCTFDEDGNVHPSAFTEETKLVYSVTEHPRGIFWFGTLTGLYRYVIRSWNYLEKNYFTGNNAVYSIFEDSKGRFYFGTLGGVNIFENGIWKKYTTTSGLRSNFIYAIAELGGEIWFGTDGGGVNILSPKGWRYLTTQDGLSSNQIHSLYVDSGNGIWVSTPLGVTRFTEQMVERYDRTNGFPFEDVAGVTQDADGTIWTASVRGLTTIRNKKGVVVTPPPNLPWGGFQSIYTAHDGSIWCGTTGNGAMLYHASLHRWFNYSDTSTPALSNNIVYTIRQDQYHRLYFLTNYGVTRFSLDRTDSVQPHFTAEYFSADDGLMNDEGNIGALFVDRDKRIWVGTIDGVSFLEPSSEIHDTSNKQLIFNNISIKDFPETQKPFSGVILSHDQNNLIFEFSLLSYFKESKNTYKVQLVGLDEQPSSWSSIDRKEYTNLTDGSYVCRVWARDFAGVNSGPIAFQFTINPPFWKTWWFRGIVALVMIAIISSIVWFFIRYSVRKEREKIERHQFLERERIRISQDMHDEVGSSLTRISILSEIVKESVSTSENPISESETLERISSIGEISRETIDCINEIIWSVNPKYDNLESLINYISKYANELLSVQNIDLEIDIPTTIPEKAFGPDFRRNIFLILKEALNNIVKHAQATIVRLRISLHQDELRIILQDNGAGINQNFTAKRSNRMGLENMRKRAVEIGGAVDISSIEEMGTKIELLIPDISQHLI